MRVSEEVGGVVGCHEFAAMIIVETTAQRRDTLVGAQQRLNSKGAKGTDYFRFD